MAKFPAGLRKNMSPEALVAWATKNYEFQGASVLVEAYTLDEIRKDFYKGGKLRTDFVRTMIDAWGEHMGW